MLRKYKVIILILIFFVSLALRINSLNQMGRTWDEPQYINQGYNLVEIIKKFDFNNPYFYTTYDHPPLVKYLYGITAHLDLKQITDHKPVFNYDYTYSRLLSALMFSIGVLIVALIAWRIFSPSVAIMAGLILSMLPFSLGLSQLVTTESLKMLFYPLAIYSYLLLINKSNKRHILFAGIATGLALQAKQTDFILFVILSIVFLIQYKQIRKKDKKEFAKKRLKALLSIAFIAGLTFIAIWPQSIFHIKEIMSINRQLWDVHFSPKIWQITLSPPELFFGKIMLTPIFYYVVYFFITIPLAILLLFFIGFKSLFKKIKIEYWVLILWFFLPFLLSIYSWRQHGLRYIIEIYPVIAILSAVGLEVLIKKLKNFKLHKGFFYFGLILYLLLNLLYIKPYYLDYFNELVGGTGNVFTHNLFQIGWWGEGEREASLYIKSHASVGSSVGLALSPEHTFPKFNSFKYLSYKENTKYDYVIVNQYHIIRDNFNDTRIKRDYHLIYSVKAAGATLVYVYKLNK